MLSVVEIEYLLYLLPSEKYFSAREGPFEIKSLEILENIAYIIAYHEDKEVPDTIEKWLNRFKIFSVYELLPKIVQLWDINLETDIQSEMTWIKE